MHLYLKNGEVKILADIDQVYGKYREGLIENIMFLYKIYYDLPEEYFK